MLTAYDQYAAEIFDEAGIPVLLVGDSAGNNVFGYETTVPVTVDELRAAGAGRHPRGQARAGRRRPAVRLLPGQPAAGARHRDPVHEGGPGATRSSSRAASAWSPAGRAAGPRRHPRHGAHRLHPAERARPRRLPRAGPRRRRPTGWSRTPARWSRPALLGRHGDGARPPWPRRSPRRCAIPTIGIGAGPRLRRPGAGLAGHGRPARRQARRGSSSSTPTCAATLDRRGRGPMPADVAGGTFPAAEHSFES